MQKVCAAVCRLKLHGRGCQSPHFEPVKTFKAKERVPESAVHLWASQLTAFFLILPVMCSLWSPPGVALARDNNHISVWSSLAERFTSRTAGTGILFSVDTAGFTPHPFAWSDWCWQFPQMKLCHSETWSMAVESQIPTAIRPWRKISLPSTDTFWCPYGTRKAAAKIIKHVYLTETPSSLGPMLSLQAFSYTYSTNIRASPRRTVI